MLKYLRSIYRTVINAYNNLPRWLVKLYMDKSIHIMLMKHSQDYNSDIVEAMHLLKKIVNSGNIDIYTL